MRLIADLHIHSHYSRATSKKLDFEHLTRWAQIKGVQILGTGDIAHPGWLQEMRDRLEPAEDGLFRLRPKYDDAVRDEVPPTCRGPVRFMLAGEISNIYKRHDAVRKVHNVIFAPTLEAVEKIQTALEKIGNIRSDGRPILGLDSRDLLEIVLETDPRCYLIPAHIWTPWFSMLGSKSGFDTVEECFGDLTGHIFALETGLSSDPPMNWRVSNLDGYTLVSSSDAHSPQKLAREATVFTTDLTYDAIFDALHTGDPDHFGGTIEFFPEEGKYHLDGHRKCAISWEPPTTLAHDGVCPVCGKKVTVGVMHRVETLADRPVGGKPDRTHPFVSLIPLPEVLSEVHGVGPNTRTVERAYFKLLDALGPELSILQDVPLEDIAAAGGSQLAYGLEHMRHGQVVALGGYDGEYGVIKVLSGVEDDASPQIGLFPEVKPPAIQETTPEYAAPEETVTLPVREDGVGSPASGWRPLPLFDLPAPVAGELDWLERLNEEQLAAVRCTDASLIISAGPGTGKTRTLTVRIAHLVRGLGVSPDAVLAITFTNKAAEEMAERMAGLLGERLAAHLTIKTFHAFGAQLLRRYAARLDVSPNFAIAGEHEQRALLRRSCPDLSDQEAVRYLQAISDAKTGLLHPDSSALAAETDELPDLPFVYRSYAQAMTAANLLDFDDLVLLPVRLLESDDEVRGQVQDRYRWISVDEYQDVNLAQYRLLRLLTDGGANLCVIGDPDQAIYGFRGADHRYVLAFSQDYRDAQSLHLRQSYRSPQTLLDAASQVIARNPDRNAVEMVSDFAEQVKLDVYHAPTDRAEAEYVVHRIEQMVGGTSYFSLDSGRVEDDTIDARSFGDFAVLYRLNAQSATLIEAFERSGIPYQTAGAASLYDRNEVRILLAHLWLLRTPDSRMHWEATLTGLGLSPTEPAFDEVWRKAQDEGASLADIYQNAAGIPSLRPAPRKRVLRMAEFWRGFQQWTGTASVVDLLVSVKDFLSGEEVGARIEEGPWFEQLILRASPHGDRLGDFLEAAALRTETDIYDPRASRVALMTLHAAKGLEFPVVFLTGCEEGLLPYLPESRNRSVDLEEERRLFYVGMTRAREKLVMTRARRRFLFGQSRELAVSPYLADIEAALLEVQECQRRPARAPAADDLQLSLF